MSLTWSLQALLVRHEEYVAEAEADKLVLRHEIDQLTMDKQLVQSKNNDLIEENRLLLEQLESANDAVTDSDTHILNLQSTLTSAQEELNKLNSLSRRTEALERELEQFEHEQSCLQASLAIKTEEEKSATLRWQTAERTLMSLEDRIEAIENEAKEERERHVEVMGRMERRRVIENELDTSAGRLNGSAAAKTTTDKHGSGVVSHFVKDILQDNANLQSSVLELKELLMMSHDEMEKLREQVNQHIIPVDLPEELTPRKSKKNLGEELAKQNAQAVHVHHHYHAPSAKPDPARRQSQMLRRPSKKKRPGVSFSSFTPPSGYQTPRNASVNSFAFPTPLSMATTLTGDSPSVHNLTVGNHRWSMMSSQAPSSIPSSPQSYQHSVFDRPFSDAGTGIDSRPTTPGTEIESPYFGASQSKRMSSASYFRPLDDVLLEYDSPDESPSAENTKPSSALLTPSPAPVVEVDNHLMPDEDEEIEHSLVDFNAQVPQPRTPKMLRGRPMSFTEDDLPPDFGQNLHMPPLRRSASHESLLSVSGMDIHTLKTRPGQMLTGLSTITGRSFSSQPVVSAATAHAARPALTPIVTRSGHRLLTGVAADQRSASSPAVNQGFGKRVGGWMFGRWGSTQPTSAGTSLSNLNPARTRSGAEVAPQEVRKHAPSSSTAARMRTPGINQPGALPIASGFVPADASRHRSRLSPAPESPSPTTMTFTTTTKITTPTTTMSAAEMENQMKTQMPTMMYSKEPILRSLDEEALRQSLNEC